MDIDKLLCALNNENNEDIVDLDFATIASNKNKILQQLNLKKSYLIILQKNKRISFHRRYKGSKIWKLYSLDIIKKPRTNKINKRRYYM